MINPRTPNPDTDPEKIFDRMEPAATFQRSNPLVNTQSAAPTNDHDDHDDHDAAALHDDHAADHAAALREGGETAWEEQGPGWVSYAGLQARLYHLGWLGEELTGVLDRREAGARVESLLSVVTAECAAVARTALALAADPGSEGDPMGGGAA